MYEHKRDENGSVHVQTHKHLCMQREREKDAHIHTNTHWNLHLSYVGKLDQFFCLFFGAVNMEYFVWSLT